MGGSNSAVVSAACHMRIKDTGMEGLDHDFARKPLMWGVTVPADVGQVGHCSFSTDEARLPNYGDLYAGLGNSELA